MFFPLKAQETSFYKKFHNNMLRNEDDILTELSGTEYAQSTAGKLTFLNLEMTDGGQVFWDTRPLQYFLFGRLNLKLQGMGMH